MIYIILSQMVYVTNITVMIDIRYIVYPDQIAHYNNSEATLHTVLFYYCK